MSALLEARPGLPTTEAVPQESLERSARRTSPARLRRILAGLENELTELNQDLEMACAMCHARSWIIEIVTDQQRVRHDIRTIRRELGETE
ncbi:hypothetical protein [Sciscionella marina]|uniref:hypothetical protein n=1 Tax=Sciscionella marina TaxID=508770 RepID=UPI000364E01D|nr:hypothetical protein [Sciscionella marina]